MSLHLPHPKEGILMSVPEWLDWSQRIAAIAQSGLTYSSNPFDIERYHALREIAAEMMAAYSGASLPEIQSLLDSQTGYTTPKIDMRGVIFRDDRVLLVRELADGCWTLPGGWVDVNEPPSRAAEREVLEESGYVVKARKLLAVYDRNQHGHPPILFHVYKLYMLCDLIGGQPTVSIETGGAEFYAEDALPQLSTTRTTPEVIRRLFEHHRHPEWPTDFD
jgi:ADP-ribose pyrophosphatase YjhB (NUDIX family)